MDDCQCSNITKLKKEKKKELRVGLEGRLWHHQLKIYCACVVLVLQFGQCDDIVFSFAEHYKPVFFFLNFLICTKSGDQPQKDLAKSGYKTNKEMKKSRNPITC